MVQIGNVPDIKGIKDKMEELKRKGLVKEWEIPYENILTRLTAAILFLTPMDESKLEDIWKCLKENPMLHYRLNGEKELSQLEWRVEFNKGFEL
jgi:hypothetical protein